MKKSLILILLFTFNSLFSQVSKEILQVKKLVKNYKLIEASSLIKKTFSTSNLSTDEKGELRKLSGDINIKLGNYEESLIEYGKASEIYNSQKNKIKFAETLGKIGIVQWKQGNIESANDNLARTASIQEELNLNNQLAKTYNNIGLVNSLSDPEKALSYYEKSLKLYTGDQKRNLDLFLITQNNIAIVNRTLDRYTTALDLFKKTHVALKNQAIKKDFQIAFTEANIAQTYLLLKDSDQALSYFNQSLIIYTKIFGSNHPEIASIHTQIASLHAANKKFDLALQEINLASKTNTKNKTDRIYFDRDLEISILKEHAEILLKKYYKKTLSPKDVKKALNLLMLSDTLIQQQRNFLHSKSDKIEFNAKAREVFECEMECLTILLNEPFAKQKGYRELIFNLIEKSKASALLSSLQDSKAKKFGNIPESILLQEQELTSKISALENDLLDQNNSSERNTNIRNELSKERNNYIKLVKQLETNYPKYFELKYSQDIVKVKEVQELMREDEMLINYFISQRDSSIIAYKITKNNTKIEQRNLSSDLSKQIILMNNSIKFNLPNAFKSASYKISKQLMLNHVPEKFTKLNIIPDGFLNNITFEALTKKPSKEDQQFKDLPYLIKAHEFNYHFSSSLWSKTSDKISSNSFHAIAPIYFEKNHDFPDLPGTAIETQKLDSIFKSNSYKTKTYTQSNAIEENLNNLTKGSILHIPTHGHVYSSSPEKSNLLLAKKDSSEDGLLYMGEIYNSTFNYDLVTLSACETGKGKQSKGEGIVGLSRAFIYSGTQNLIVSYWKVDDRSTAELMINFYLAHLKTKNSFSKSLQESKKKMILGEEYSNPYYWAPFILIGR